SSSPWTRRSHTAPNPRLHPLRAPRPSGKREPARQRTRLEGTVGASVPFHADRVTTPAARRPERGAGPGERVEHRVALDREHPHQPFGELGRERGAPPPGRILASAPDIGPDLAEPAVSLFAREPAGEPSGVVGRETPELSLAEEENVLAVEGHVGVRWQEPRVEERVGAVGRLLPEDVRERNQAEASRRHERLGRVRPEAKLPVRRAERIADV